MSERSLTSPRIREIRGLVRRQARALALLVVFLCAVIPRLATAGHFENVDEYRWMQRSHAFGTAIQHLRFSDASAVTAQGYGMAEIPTMPGIPTMWLGWIAQGVWRLAKLVHLVPADAEFLRSMSGLQAAQSAVAIASSLLIVLMSWLLGRWTRPRVGLAAGLLLASSPFWVALGAWMHTDELSTLFGFCGILALLIALGILTDGTLPAHPSRWAFASGALLIAAPLTKLSGAVFVLSAALIVGATVLARARRGAGVTVREVAGGFVRPLVRVATGAIVTAAVLYPALWASPGRELWRLWESARIASTAQHSFYGGGRPPNPPWTFYLVALPQRLTPLSSIVIVVGLIAVLRWRPVRRRAAVLVGLVALPALVMLSVADAKFDRYGLLVLAPIVAAACLPLERVLLARPKLERAVAPGILAVGVAAAAVSWWIAPYGIVTFNPLTGGGSRAFETIHVGWNQGADAAIASIRADVEARGLRCDDITLSGPSLLFVYRAPCWQRLVNADEADYFWISVSHLQRASMDNLRGANIRARHARRTAPMEYVGEISYRGLTLYEIWRRPSTVE